MFYPFGTYYFEVKHQIDLVHWYFHRYAFMILNIQHLILVKCMMAWLWLCMKLYVIIKHEL
jgi:hypothetical protein